MLDRNNIRSMGKWAGFLGIMSIIGGVICCISCFGLIQGIFQIILGMKLRNAQKYAEQLALFQDPAGEAGRLNGLFTELESYFKINGILMIITLILGVLSFLMFFIFIPVLSSYLENAMRNPYGW